MNTRTGWLFFLTLSVLSVAQAASPQSSPGCDVDHNSKVKNFCVVKEVELWRGARPSADGAVDLINRGVRTVVNLELIHNDAPVFDQIAVPPNKSNEIEYFRVRDWEPNVKWAPRLLDEHVAHFLAITRTRPKPLFVHCRQGQNRTGVMVAAYRVFNGIPIEEAIAEMKRYNGLFFNDDAKYIRTLTAARRAEFEPKIAQWIPKLKMEAKIFCRDGVCSVDRRPDK